MQSTRRDRHGGRTQRTPDASAPGWEDAAGVTATVVAPDGFLGWRGAGGNSGRRVREGVGLGRRNLPPFRRRPCLASISHRPSRTDDRLPADAIRVSRRTGQRHPADHRGVAHARPGHGRPSPLAPHRRRQGRTDPSRTCLGSIHRSRRPHGPGRCVHHACARQIAAVAASGTAAGAGASWRSRGSRSRLQHAVGRDRVRHRGTEPLVRGTHLRHRFHRRGGGRCDHAWAGRQLHLFRPDLRRVGQQRRLAEPSSCAAWQAAWQVDCSARR